MCIFSTFSTNNFRWHNTQNLIQPYQTLAHPLNMWRYGPCRFGSNFRVEVVTWWTLVVVYILFLMSCTLLYMMVNENPVAIIILLSTKISSNSAGSTKGTGIENSALQSTGLPRCDFSIRHKRCIVELGMPLVTSHQAGKGRGSE